MYAQYSKKSLLIQESKYSTRAPQPFTKNICVADKYNTTVLLVFSVTPFKNRSIDKVQNLGNVWR